MEIRFLEFGEAAAKVRGQDPSSTVKYQIPSFKLTVNYVTADGVDITQSISRAADISSNDAKKVAAANGNYIYVNEPLFGNDEFELGTVVDGAISKLETFTKNSEDEFVATSRTTFEVTKSTVQTKKNFFGGIEKFRTVTTKAVTENLKTGETKTETFIRDEKVED